MGQTKTDFDTVYADLIDPGLPVTDSNLKHPPKSDIRVLGGHIDDRFNAIETGQAGGAVAYATYAALVGRIIISPVPTDGMRGYVSGDAGTHTDPVVGGTVSNSGEFRFSTSPSGWQRIGNYNPQQLADNITAETVARTAADVTINTRIDDNSLHLMLTTTGSGVNFSGTATPAIPVSPQDGLRLIFTLPVANLEGANIVGLAPFSFMDGTLIYSGAIPADVPTEAVLIGGKLRLTGGSDMDAPVTWFSGSDIFGTSSVTLLPETTSLKDWYIENISTATGYLGPGGVDPGEGVPGTIVIPAGGFRSSDRLLATPFIYKSSAANSPLTFWFSTKDGRNPIADSLFDALLARHSTVFSDPWDAALRSFFSACLPQITKCIYFNPHLGPDNTFANTNWALNTNDTVFNTPARNSKTGYAFTGNTGLKYIDTGVTQASLSASDISMGIGTVDTSPAGANSPASAVSNQVNAIENMRTSGIAMHSSTTSTDTVAPAVMGGLVAWSRSVSTGYTAYSAAETFAITRSGTIATVYNFLIGVAAAPSIGGPNAGTYHTGNIDLVFIGHKMSALDIANLQSARLTLLSDISGL